MVAISYQRSVLGLVAQTPGFNDRKTALPEDNPLVIGSPYPLPVWSAVTLKNDPKK